MFLNKQKVMYFTYFENALFISALKLDCFLSNILQSVSCSFFLTYRKIVIWNCKEKEITLQRRFHTTNDKEN